MFNKNNHKIIDERQELQSLKNMKICWLTIISLLALSIMIQAVVFTVSPLYYIPEVAILLIVCFLNIILDIRQGNLYTKEMQNKKFNLLLYVFSSLAVGLMTAVGNYLKYDFPPIFMLVIVIPMFLFTLALMLLCDYFYRKAAQKRLNKLNAQAETDDDL
ncbi:DUF6773 family protein [Aminipila sp.]|uniref:DUF6773 family protein n=1 Tax=Aminipila sp. TaxID=2060095 RepID=UPI0028A188CD|nr:DUF6773 family protein [Aminipila sp.]